MTLALTFAFLGVGLAVGLPVSLAQVFGGRPLRAAVTAFERTFRAIPAIVLLFLFYYGVSQFGLNLSVILAASLAMGLRSAAFQSQIFRGAIQSVEPGQIEAARSIGMGQAQVIAFVVLPQALRLSVAPWSNEFVVVLKDTSLVFAIGVTELMREGRYIVAREFGHALLIYLVIALIYFLFSSLAYRLFGALESVLSVPGYETSAGADKEMIQ